jgi:ThiF family
MMSVTSWTLTIPDGMATRLQRHLFPGDHDEHGAIILAGVATNGGDLRLLARELYLAEDGIDYVAGVRGYRMLRGEFIRDNVLRARDERLVYLAIHNHSGSAAVGFSGDDLASQQRGYPALLDITGGIPVGALVFAEEAIAGNLWISPSQALEMWEARIVGIRRVIRTASPRRHRTAAGEMYDRQSRLFGDAGQALLAGMTIGIIGAGGVGTLLVEYLARLGVGRLIIADPDRIDLTNLSRLPQATLFDARAFLTAPGRPAWLRRLGKRWALRKVDLATRICRRANPAMQVVPLFGDITDDSVARQFLACDYLFLAADTMQARLVFNAIVSQYLIPGWQVGSKVVTGRVGGEVQDVYSVVRPVVPGAGCLMCNELISAAKLQEESLSPEERHRQRYVDDPLVVAPSVITLNAVAAAHAANDLLFSATGLTLPTTATDYHRFLPRERSVVFEDVQQRPACSECSTEDASRFARGDARRLPTRMNTGKEVIRNGKDSGKPRQAVVER